MKADVAVVRELGVERVGRAGPRPGGGVEPLAMRGRAPNAANVRLAVGHYMTPIRRSTLFTRRTKRRVMLPDVCGTAQPSAGAGAGSDSSTAGASSSEWSCSSAHACSISATFALKTFSRLPNFGQSSAALTCHPGRETHHSWCCVRRGTGCSCDPRPSAAAGHPCGPFGSP